MTEIKKHLAEAAINIVTGARRGSYGKPENNFGRIAKLWNAWFEAKGWALVPTEHADAEHILELSPADISPMMRLMKEARLCETPNHYDSHLDIIGYAMTGAEVSNVQVPLAQERVMKIVDHALTEQARKYEARIQQLELSLHQRAIPVPPPASSDQVTASLVHDHSDAVQERGHTSQ